MPSRRLCDTAATTMTPICWLWPAKRVDPIGYWQPVGRVAFGHETNERHNTAAAQRAQDPLRGKQLALSDIPGEPALRSAFDTVASRYAIQDGLFAVPQTQGTLKTRIILGAQLLRASLIEAGLKRTWLAP